MQTCEAFSANRYPFPEEAARQRQMHADVSGRLRELSSTIDAGGRRRGAVLENLARSLQSWVTVVRREKAVYHTMNQLSFDVTQQALVAEAWAPLDARVPIQNALQKGDGYEQRDRGYHLPAARHARAAGRRTSGRPCSTECFHQIVAVRFDVSMAFMRRSSIIII